MDHQKQQLGSADNTGEARVEIIARSAGSSDRTKKLWASSHEQSAAPNRASHARGLHALAPATNSHTSGQAQRDTRLEQNRQAAQQNTPEHKTWQSIWQSTAQSAENQHSPLNTENTPPARSNTVPQHLINTEPNGAQ